MVVDAIVPNRMNSAFRYKVFAIILIVSLDSNEELEVLKSNEFVARNPFNRVEVLESDNNSAHRQVRENKDEHNSGIINTYSATFSNFSCKIEADFFFV